MRKKKSKQQTTLTRLELDFDVVKYLADIKTVKHEDNVSLTCPRCNKPDKLWVLVKEKRSHKAGSFVCYYCRDVNGEGLGSGPLALIRWMTPCSIEQAIKTLATYADKPEHLDFKRLVREAINARGGTQEEPLPECLWPDHYRPVNEHPYLTERNISKRTAERYRLGVCAHGYYANRLIVPVFMRGVLTSFSARWLAKVPPPGVKKTIFPKGTKVGRMLFNYDRAKHCDSIVIVEDPFSAMRVGKRAVATFGTSLSANQRSLLAKTNASELVLLWDHDAIGKAEALARDLAGSWRVRIVRLPTTRDADQYSRRAIKARIASAESLAIHDWRRRLRVRIRG